MLEFLCGIPGADASTVAWHATIHLGLTAFVTATGTAFLVAAVIAYRRPRPTGGFRTVDPGRMSASTVPADQLR